jgi:hypothetical protein
MERRIKIFLIRHSKSCANHVRHLAGTDDLDHPLVAESQKLLDPALSTIGERMAIEYGPVLRDRLRSAGFNLQTAIIGSSALRRAKQTASLLFEKSQEQLTEFPHFTEHGRIPENMPIAGLHHHPDWDAFLRFVAAQRSSNQFIVVGHGSYLRTEAWPAVSTKEHKRFGNLDGFIVEADVSPRGHLKKVVRVQEIPFTGSSAGADSCPLPAKIAVLAREMKGGRKTKKQRKSRKHKQQGGYVGMPLAYFKDGAQMVGTSADTTGMGLAHSSDAWVRAPLAQTGGGCNTPDGILYPHAQKAGGCSCDGPMQQGGFPPSVMGAFASNGARLIPVAAYMGYQMWEKSRPKKTPRRPRLRRSQTRRGLNTNPPALH